MGIENIYEDETNDPSTDCNLLKSLRKLLTEPKVTSIDEESYKPSEFLTPSNVKYDDDEGFVNINLLNAPEVKASEGVPFPFNCSDVYDAILINIIDCIYLYKFE